MKHILIAAVLTGCTLFGGEIHWMHSYKEGAKLAKEVYKPMLLFIYKPGCGACCTCGCARQGMPEAGFYLSGPPL